MGTFSKLSLIRKKRRRSRQSGDTLVEVTMALAILSAVLVGATFLASSSFRTGQAAKERTSMSTVSQGQLEALRAYRDNHSWDEFQNGVEGVRPSFHMEYNAGLADWVPTIGNLPAADVPVPEGVINIKAVSDPALAECGYDFELTSTFPPAGNGTPLTNVIKTRLVNLQYRGDPAGCLI